MTEVPKIVYDRLRAASLERAFPERALPQQAAPEPAHPDADLLTAFAEQALSATEREDVIGHLALCGDCREVIALALPAADPVGAPIAADTEAARAMAVSTKSKRGWLTSQAFAWPSLRWAALAAGVAVAASVLLMHPGKLNQATLPSATPQVATTVPPASDSRFASSPMAKSSADLSAALAQTGEARFNAKSPWSKKAASEQAVTAARAKQGILLADNRKDAATADKPSPALSTGAAALDKTIVGRPSEVVEVTAESPTVQAEVSADDRRMARSNAPAIEKAKPARRTETGQMQNTISSNIGELPRQAKNEVPLTKQESPASQPLARNVTWAIKTGILQRSLDSGQSWQNALRADHSLLCYASHDEDVWAGGQAGTLFHSSDGGVTWMQVQASVKGQALSSDVTHIDVRSDVRSDARGDAHGLAEIVLSTRNNETWSSLDAGKTWEKK